MADRKSLYILGVRVDDVTYNEAVVEIDCFVRKRTPHQIVTVNPEFIIAARRDVEFRHIINHAALSLPDGAGLLWASRLLGHPLRERVTGVDMLQHLADLATQRGYAIFLLGAAPGVAAEAARRLAERFPRLMIAGTHVGSPEPTEEPEIIEIVRCAAPDMLFVAYGAPKQDKWIARNLDRLGVPVAMGVGGAFDFISGRAQRAPMWMRRAGLEWLHRLYREPWRWRRMLALPAFAWLVITERIGLALRRGR
ncbi:MAG: WecB/TagA/CpsF family glycosyltransferase [Chloroflexi bacterium]|nr:WecB/TagA/CpsF family glycosyltransferase [Chloroflexota bacterium]